MECKNYVLNINILKLEWTCLHRRILGKILNCQNRLSEIANHHNYSKFYAVNDNKVIIV